MSKFEWMELETLSNEIAHAQSRLDAARAAKNHGLIRLLEQEIAETTERRARVLADITKGVAASGSAKRTLAAVPQKKIKAPAVQGERESAERVEAPATTGVPSPAPAQSPDAIKGVAAVWDQLRRADIERVKRELGLRRAEVLSRHAEELKALDAQQTEIDAFERAIEAFAKKFNGGAEVVPFDPEHSAQTQAG